VAHYNQADQTGLANPRDTFAIGLLFTDNTPSGPTSDGAAVIGHWDFLSIDGVAPSIPNAVSGKYHFVTTETWQYRNRQVGGAPALTRSQLNLANGLFTMLAVPAVLAVQPGFLALPDVFDPSLNGGQGGTYIPGTDGNNVWKGTTGGPNAC